MPIKLFSFIPKPIVPPSVPTPAAALNSPVGFSFNIISIILELFAFPSLISFFTSLKKPKLLRLLIVLLTSISLNGSPSSTSN